MNLYPTANPEDLAEFFASLNKMETDVTNIWVRQIETGRFQSEQAIIELAARFEAIVRNLGNAMEASEAKTVGKRGAKRNVLAVLQDSEGKLHGVVNLLERSMDNRDLLLGEVKKLSSYINDLEGMADSVSSLATQTNMLSINAAIEAAHAGERGKGFAIVASEVRSLSMKSRESGLRIRETIKIISTAIAATFDTAEAFAHEDSSRVESAKQDIGCVLNDFSQMASGLESSADSLRESAKSIKDEISEALVHMQFQDRISQILCHVRDNISKLPAFIGSYERQCIEKGRLSEIDWTELIDELMESYATNEEFLNHGSKQKVPNKRAASPITFF
jgi:methyl-accepting chemotaxis protein